MQKAIKVFKFGGASIKDAAAIRNIGSILSDKYSGDIILIVVSALGKTTNALERVVKASFNKTEDINDALDNVWITHHHIANDLFDPAHPVNKELKELFEQLKTQTQTGHHKGYDYFYDQIISFGELMSSKIIAAYLTALELDNQWLDARSVIRTDDTYREGIIDWEITNQQINQEVIPLLNIHNYVITQGFIASNQSGETTTLGREGSDFTAAIFSYCLDAVSMSIWKDVPGILTGDPRLFDNVIKIDRLSYKEAIEMTYYGAKVIHPKTIKPLQNKNIPLMVKSFIDPDGEGTFISDGVDVRYPPVVVVEKDQILLHISTRDFSFVAEHHLSYLFKLFAKHRIKINMMRNSAISFTVCAGFVSERIDGLRAEIEKEFKLIYDKNLELITVRHFQEDMLAALLKNKIVVYEVRLEETIQMVVKNIRIMKPL